MRVKTSEQLMAVWRRRARREQFTNWFDGLFIPVMIVALLIAVGLKYGWW